MNRYARKRDQTIKFLAECTELSIQNILAEAKELAENKIFRVPEDVLENLTDKYTALCQVKYTVPVQIEGMLSFRVGYYSHEEAPIQLPDGPTLSGSSWKIDWSRIVKGPEEDPYGASSDSADWDCYFMRGDTILDDLAENIPGAKEFHELFVGVCKEYGVEDFDLQTEILKIKERRDIERRNGC